MLVVLGACTLNASAAVLNVNASGILMGASDVDIGGTLYDVSFADGILSDITPFFTTSASALAASQALLNQVLIDGPLGQFNSNSELTNGCTLRTGCKVWTVYSLTSSTNSVRYGQVQNYSASTGLNDLPITTSARLTTNVVADPTITLATWSLAKSAPTTAVPEPQAYAMFLAGLGLMGFATRRKKST